MVNRLGLCHVISTHALHEEGDAACALGTAALVIISTHALHEEGDPEIPKICCNVGISTHALHEEGD